MSLREDALQIVAVGAGPLGERLAPAHAVATVAAAGLPELLAAGTWDAVFADAAQAGACATSCRASGVPLVVVAAASDLAGNPVAGAAFDVVPPDLDGAPLAACVRRLATVAARRRERDAARTERDGVLEALRALDASAARLVHDVKAPRSALGQALSAVAGKLGVDAQTVLTEFSRELETVEQRLARVLRYAQPIGSGSTSLVALLQAINAAPTGREFSLEVSASDVNRGVVPGATDDWCAALSGLLTDLAAGGGPEARLQLSVEGSAAGATFEVAGPESAPSGDRQTSGEPGLGEAYCHRLVRAHGGRMAKKGGAASASVTCYRIYLPLTVLES